MERNKQIDISKGIAIILMILGHSFILTANWTNFFFKFVYSFHMPLFIIFSGYYFKIGGGGILKKNLKLIKPYLITALVGCIILSVFSIDDALRYAKGCIVGTVGSPVSKIRFYTWQAGAIWFLLALFWCKVYFALIVKYLNRWWLEASVFLSLIFIFICYNFINIPLCIGAGFTFLIFYAIGLFLHRIDINAIKHRWLIYLFWFVSLYYTTLNTAQYTYDILPLSILGAVCGTITIYDLSYHIKGYFAKFLTYAGKNTLLILCCHSVAWATKDTILTSLGYDKTEAFSNDIAFLKLTILYFLVLYLTNKSILKCFKS